MAGKTLDEACATQSATCALQKSCNNCRNTMPATSQANTADNGSTSVLINGKHYILDNSTATTTKDNTNHALTALTMEDYDHEEYITVLATADNPLASVDWHSHSHTVDEANATSIPVAYSTGKSPIAHTDELPFILNTGTTCHISPEPLDFKVLRNIPCHPVKGLCGLAVYATGVGDIELHIASGHKLKLMNVLYVPQSCVCLISILALNKSSDYTMHFDSNGCWVMNKSNTVLIWGSLSNSKHLYILSIKTPSIQHCKPTSTLSTALSAIVPDLETWHRHLRHCNITVEPLIIDTPITQ